MQLHTYTTTDTKRVFTPQNLIAGLLFVVEYFHRGVDLNRPTCYIIYQHYSLYNSKRPPKSYHVVHFRFTPRRCPRRRAGGRTDLCPGGRGDVVHVQEEHFALPRASHARQRLLQTNRLAGHRVGRKCADHTPGGSFGRIALSDSFLKGLYCSSHHLSASRHFPIRCGWHCTAVTPQDRGEMGTPDVSSFVDFWERAWRILVALTSFHAFWNTYMRQMIINDICCEPTLESSRLTLRLTHQWGCGRRDARDF